LLLIALSGGCLGGDPAPPPIAARPPRVHPVFLTTVTDRPGSRPAVQVNILDPSKYWFFTAKLYLTVQSSRFPSDLRVVLPLNVGGFEGDRNRFVQLPFEVQAGDMVVFNLLDDRTFTPDQERSIIEGCRLVGLCVVAAGTVYCPEAMPIVSPSVDAAADVLGRAVVKGVSFETFTNYGTAEYVVPAALPNHPQEANKLTVLDDSRYARVVLRVYGPEAPLPYGNGPL
jgi:hypothetical protein